VHIRRFAYDNILRSLAQLSCLFAEILQTQTHDRKHPSPPSEFMRLQVPG
jgi:hypothetical protein